MNQLSVSLQHSIAMLAAKGWSYRKIALELDVDSPTGRFYFAWHLAIRMGLLHSDWWQRKPEV